MKNLTFIESAIIKTFFRSEFTNKFSTFDFGNLEKFSQDDLMGDGVTDQNLHCLSFGNTDTVIWIYNNFDGQIQMDVISLDGDDVQVEDSEVIQDRGIFKLELPYRIAKLINDNEELFPEID